MKRQTERLTRAQDSEEHQVARVSPSTLARRVKVLVETAILVSLAAYLNLFPIFTAPFGGSITLGGMTPIFILALRRGVRTGISAGVILGLVILIFQPFFVTIFQVLLDYPLAFGALGLSGFFRKRPFPKHMTASALVGVVVGILGRFCCHFVSGVLFFAVDAPAGMSAVVYSAVYNWSYLGPELGNSLILMAFIAHRRVLEVFP